MRTRAKRDQSEQVLAAYARARGMKVLRLDAFDLLVLYKGVLLMVEAKTGRGRYTDRQQKLLDDGWPLQTWRTTADIDMSCDYVDYGLSTRLNTR